MCKQALSRNILKRRRKLIIHQNTEDGGAGNTLLGGFGFVMLKLSQQLIFDVGIWLGFNVIFVFVERMKIFFGVTGDGAGE